MTKTTDTAIPAPQPDDAGCDPIEDRLRETVRATIEALFDEELAAIGVRRDGQKILLSIRHMGGESTSSWRRSGGFRGRTAATVHPHLEDLDARGLKRPDFVIAGRRAGAGGRAHHAVGRRAADPALHRAQDAVTGHARGITVAR